MIEGGSFEEPPFYFLGAFFQPSQSPFRDESIHHPRLVGFLCLTGIGRIDKEFHRFFLRSKKEVAGEKLLPLQHRFFVEGLIHYFVIID